MQRLLVAGARIALAASLVAACASVTKVVSPSPSLKPTIGAAPASGTPTPAASATESGDAPFILANWGDQWEGGCGGSDRQASLHGDRYDPSLAWLESTGAGGEPERHGLTWPPGFTARFTPRLEILDPIGQVVMREGDLIESTCVDAGTIWGTWVICGPMRGTECARRFALLLRDNGWPERVFVGVRFTDELGSYAAGRLPDPETTVTGVAPFE